MLKIRLARTGRRNQPRFRVVVADHKRPADSNFIEILGWHDPTQDGEQELQVEKEDIENWIEKGAQPSNRVAKLLNKYLDFDFDIKERHRPPKSQEAEEEAETEEADMEETESEEDTSADEADEEDSDSNESETDTPETSEDTEEENDEGDEDEDKSE